MSDVTEIVGIERVVEPGSTDALSRPGVITATLVGFTKTGAPIVKGAASPVHIHGPARSCVPLADRDIGKLVVVLVDEGLESPIVVGLIQPNRAAASVEITVDGRDISVTAQDSITLKCGEASITLNRDGKVVIRGKHVVTQASGVNRIRGGSVQLN
jgi:Domain of unknown function (DUF6484)